MNVVDSEAQALIRSTAREFVETACALPQLVAQDRGEPALDGLWPRMAALGWSGLLVPEALGGSESALDDAATLCNELGRGLVPGPFLSSAILSTLLILRSGSAERQRQLLPAMAAGETVVVPALTEAQHGWQPQFMELRGEPDGDGLRLNGVKQFVPDVDAAAQLIVLARTGANPKDVTLLLVEPSRAGVSVGRMPGWSREPLFDVAFKDVRVERAQVLGELNGGWDALEPVLDVGSVLLCSYLCGAMERVYTMTMTYAHHRVQFGQPIARFQRVQDRLIEMRNCCDAADATTREAVEALAGAGSLAQLASLAKQVTSTGFYQVCEEAHHVHAGIGSDKQYGLYLFTQAAHQYYHYLGSPEHHTERLAGLLEL